MHPLSNERADWVHARLFILNLMIREFNEHTPRYQSSQGMVSAHTPVMLDLEAERLKLTIEYNSLREYQRTEAAAKVARAQEELNAKGSSLGR
jgi:hypothetical protein